MKTIFFPNETKRYLEGEVAPGPSLRSDAAREFPSDNITYVNEEEGIADCLAASNRALRVSIGLDTYRSLPMGRSVECCQQFYQVRALIT